ncbi:uncharacterized oxidoreductase SERP2049-like [Sitodiplosis mosellana]|uniref:uncharacterized oxidoreductase SERP2049-like n=1 Tax=Sitodiplosis mosellana TaxID=263140 RepID=UPI002443ECF6|nr:uncharacterized oxidoreductase SERP2049-like [Sitodiplosis mosellana]
MKFKEKVVLITGADSALGRACAEFFGSEGALLALVGQNEKEFVGLLKRIKVLCIQNKPHIILANFAIESERIMGETIDTYGHLDILINGSGTVIIGTITDLNMDDYDMVMLSNLRGVIEMTKQAIPHLIKTKGNIINVSSICSDRQFGGFLAYSVSKAALDQFTKCAAIELASKQIRVNSINPGFIMADFMQLTSGYRFGDEYIVPDPESETVTAEVKHIEKCLNTIAFFATDHTHSYVSGAILPVIYDGVVNVVTV